MWLKNLELFWVKLKMWENGKMLFNSIFFSHTFNLKVFFFKVIQSWDCDGRGLTFSLGMAGLEIY